MKQQFSAVIMAGGSGTRFWPRSRRTNPKQTLPFLNGESLLQRTVKRLQQVIECSDIYVITGKDQLDITTKQLQQLPRENIIGEPQGRNTAPCIALAAALLLKKSPDKPMLVVAADHFIEDEIEWLNVFTSGAAAAANTDRVIVFGVVPQRPHTGYGYISYAEEEEAYEGNTLFKVDAFKEKPDIQTAMEYVKSGTFFWNSGCFGWMPSTVSSLVKTHMPELHDVIEKIISSESLDEGMTRYYGQAPDVSVDYGILEHADNIYGMKLDAGWNDVGSWPSLFDVLPADEQGNITFGDELIVKDCENSIIWGEEQLVTAVGLKDMIVVQSHGAVMVCPRSAGQDVRKIVAELKKRQLKDYL